MKKSQKLAEVFAIDAFLALSDEEKEAVYRSVDREIPLSETRPLTAAQRKLWERAQAQGARPPESGRRGQARAREH